MDSVFLHDFKNYKGFDEIDAKVKFIEQNRSCCDDVIRELNSIIDLDYVKESEFIEANTLDELKYIELDDTVKVVRGYPKFISNMPNDNKEREEYLKHMKINNLDATLIIYQKAQLGEIKKYVCQVPKHLTAVDFALSYARRDKRELKNTGKMPNISLKFIEYINSKFFEKTEHQGEKGYGNIRKIFFENGEYKGVAVKLEDDAWQPVPCEIVDSEMESLIREYNNADCHPILKAIRFKTRFNKIHPFADGNGRTSRILLNYMLVRYGYPTITIKGIQRRRYIEAMDTAIIKGDYSLMIDLIKDLLNKRCDKYISIIQEHMEKDAEKENDI